jgi:hypothetical protein
MSETEHRWGDYQIAVLKDLERLSEDMKTLTKEVAQLDSKIAVLQFQAGAWGFLSGAIVAAAALLTGKL